MRVWCSSPSAACNCCCIVEILPSKSETEVCRFDCTSATSFLSRSRSDSQSSGVALLLLNQVESSVDNYRRQSRLGDGVATMNGLHRPLSGLSETNTNNTDVTASAGAGGHARNMSDGAASMVSDATGANGRDSFALDSLASELETLRSHWETTKNFRLSDKFDFEKTALPGPGEASSASHGGEYGSVGSGDYGTSMADWRRGLDESDDDEEEKSRPASRSEEEGTVRGGEREDDEQEGMAVTTPTQNRVGMI